MTNEQAKEIMIAYRDRLTSSCSNQLNSDIEAFNLAIKALEVVDFQDYEDKRQYSGERTMFDDCCPCTNCLNDECAGCVYDLMHKGAEG